MTSGITTGEKAKSRVRSSQFALASAVIVLVALFVTSVAWSGQRDQPPSPPYTVAQVQSGIAHHPELWLDRTVRVSGYFSATCAFPSGGQIGDCTLRPPGEPPFGLAMRPSTPTYDALLHSLPLAPAEDGFLARTFPHLFAPPEQTLLYGHRGIYTVTITRLSRCDLENLSTPCVVGLIAGAHMAPQ